MARLNRHIRFEDGCMVWVGALNNCGYPRMNFRVAGRHTQVMVHRLMYVLYTRQDIPEGLTIDHLCNRRNCVDPRHMEAVTHSENMARQFERRRAEMEDFEFDEI